MGKAAISIPAPRTPSARAMYPGLISLGQDYEQAFTAYNGLNLGSTNGADQIQVTVSDTEPAPATTTRRQQNRKTTGRRKWTAAQRQEQSERAKAVHAARNRKTAGKAMSAGG